jgi:hypothetical protein
MTTTRILFGTIVVVLASAGSVAAQSGMPPYSLPNRNANVVPSVFPSSLPEPTVASEQPQPTDYGLKNRFPTSPQRPVMPRYGVRQASGDEPQPYNQSAPSSTLQHMTMPTPPGGSGDAPNPAGTLATAGDSPLPKGSYASPWYSDGCCGPTGRNGNVGYELYAHTGPGIITGHTVLSGHMHTGWEVAGGGRSLFFNTAHDAAWVIDLGMSYNYNRGNLDLVNTFIRVPLDPNTNAKRPDLFLPVRIRGLHRTAFNFSAGRDWWLLGPGNVGECQGWNVRVGADLGGRWGTAHVDMVPLDDETLYSRRQKVFHGMFISGHADVEHAFGGWIWFGGLKLQYGIDWMDIIPPQTGDVQFMNILINTGFRF